MSEADSSPTGTGERPTQAEDPQPKEPSLGPACLVVSILGLATLCAVCAFGSFFMFSDQYPLATRSIEQQLIPWVETSQLSEVDRKAIVGELQRLLPMLEQRTIDKQQLTRLRNCLQDNPVLLWGGIESIQQQAQQSGLTETEQAALERISQRLLRGSADRKLSRNDVEFTIQNCSRVRERGQSLEVLNPLSDEQIREFLQRAEQVVERNGIPNEPYDSSAGEAFRLLIDAALAVEPE